MAGNSSGTSWPRHLARMTRATRGRRSRHLEGRWGIDASIDDGASMTHFTPRADANKRTSTQCKAAHPLP